MVPESLPFAGGEDRYVAELSRLLVDLPDIQGITFSGGEPLVQSAALVELVDQVRARRDLSFMSYTGFTYEQLRDSGTPAQQQLLARLDILIDGPYIASRHTELVWRGSDNQRVILLSERHRDIVGRLDDRGVRMEIEVTPTGVGWMGIPPKGFTTAFRQALSNRGITVGEQPIAEFGALSTGGES